MLQMQMEESRHKTEKYAQLGEVSSIQMSDDDEDELFGSDGEVLSCPGSASAVLSPTRAGKARMMKEKSSQQQQHTVGINLGSMSDEEAYTFSPRGNTRRGRVGGGTGGRRESGRNGPSSSGSGAEERKPKKSRSRVPGFEDHRFRVNGIVVDQEIRGGPKLGWEGIYQIMFQSSTPKGQQMALGLLVMVSFSVIVGEWFCVADISECHSNN